MLQGKNKQLDIKLEELINKPKNRKLMADFIFSKGLNPYPINQGDSIANFIRSSNERVLSNPDRPRSIFISEVLDGNYKRLDHIAGISGKKLPNPIKIPEGIRLAPNTEVNNGTYGANHADIKVVDSNIYISSSGQSY